jgi:hypothetical protein
MTQRFRDEGDVILRFGGGRNSRASEDQIDPLECADGENFLLDPGNSEFRPREPFDLVGTAPNGSQINGFVTLQKTDGTVSMLVQAGTNVYEVDSAFTFSLVGTVASGTKIRGRKEAFWALADKVLIADLGLAEPISTWDGSTFQNETFLQSDGSTAFGAFRCKYIVVENERAFFGNIHDNGSTFPHLLVGSQRGDYLVVDTATRPSTSASAEDPFFLPMPQLKPINGMAYSFGVLAISQEFGAFEKLTGSDAQDYALDKLHRGSGARGDEAMVAIPNDILFGALGRIDSLQSTDKFGDVELDDVSFKIADDIASVKDWTLEYNERLKRVYCIPDGGNEIHVCFIDFIRSQLSPWSKYTTQNVFSFQPTATMSCFDPSDGLEYVFMGDSTGNVYRLEGASGGGDAGGTSIQSFRDSVLNVGMLDGKTFGAKGWVQFRKQAGADVDLRFLFAGENVYDKQITVTLPAVVFSPVYNGSAYYGGNEYYGAKNENRLVRSTFGVAHFANQWQVRTSLETVNDFDLTEIGIRYDFAG